MTRKEITENIKTLSGIDALYYQLMIDWRYYSVFYEETLIKGKLDNYQRLTRLSRSFTNQYVNYDVLSINGKKIATILFKNLNTDDGLESITIQHDTTYMNIHGYLKSYHDVIEFLELLGLEVITSKIQRMDLNSYVFNVDLDFLKYEYFSTLSKNNSTISEHTVKGTEKQTFTLGSRSSDGVYMRIYNKRAELLVNDKDCFKQSMIMYRYKMKYNDEINLMQDKFYNIEFELKRAFLKKYQIETVEQALEKRYHIMKDIMTKRIRMLAKQHKPNTKNKQRIDTHIIWEIVLKEYLPNDENYDITRLKDKKYSHDENWFLARLEEFLKENRPTDELISTKIKVLEIFNQTITQQGQENV